MGLAPAIAITVTIAFAVTIALTLMPMIATTVVTIGHAMEG